RVDPARLEAVDGVPLERRVPRVERPWLEEAPGCRFRVQVGEALAGKAHELPPPAARAAGDDGRRPRRVAHLAVDRHPRARLARDDVHDEPVEEEAEVGDRHAELAADEAVRAVAADEPS